MKTLILYHSKTGFTERYAKWLAEALQGDCVPFQNRRKIDLSLYDRVVFGAGCHAGTIRKLKWLKDNLPKLAGKSRGKNRRRWQKPLRNLSIGRTQLIWSH